MAELSLFVKVTLVLILALLAARLASRAAAAVRSLMLACAFGLLVLLPVAAVTLPARAIEVPAAYSAPSAAATLTALPPFSTPSVAADIAPVPATHFGTPSVGAALRLLWAAGAVGFFAPMVVGLWSLRRLRTRGRPWAHSSQPSSVEMLLHDDVHVPVTYGALRPVIALPIDAPQWPQSDLRRVLLHELEHVRRRDWPVHMVARAICALYWFHPLVWIAWRQLRLESERACDDAVLREEDGAAYAAQLVSLARRITKRDAMPLLSIARRSNLSRRVGAVLAANVARGPVRRAAAVAVAGLAAVAALGIGPLQAVTPTQTPSGPSSRTTLGFESTSIRRTAPLTTPTAPCCQVRYATGGRMSAANVGLADLIVSAYSVYGWQIVGAPGWSDGDQLANNGSRFDVQALARREVNADDMRLMLRTMLADRFHLAVHRETRVQKVYQLVVEPGGHKLETPGDREYVATEDIWLRVDPTTLIARTLRVDRMTMAELTRNLGAILHTMVFDRTRLTGAYQVGASWNAGPSGVGRPTILEAFPTQLGLGLRETTSPVEYLVVDRAERPTLDDAR